MRILATILFTLVAALCGGHRPARAASAESLLQRVQAGGFTCTGSGGGSFCVSGDRKLYILIPSGAQVKKTVLYAHGNLGVCGNGLSGENFLKDQMAELGRRCAIGVLPSRNTPGEGFPIDQYLDKLDSLLGTKLGAVIGGHSSGGHAISEQLGKICSAQPSRIKDIVFFDAAYSEADGDLIRNALKSCKFKVGSFAKSGSNTLTTAKRIEQTINTADPNTAVTVPVSEGHCEIPRAHLNDLVSKSNCDGETPPDPPQEKPRDQQPPPREAGPPPSPPPSPAAQPETPPPAPQEPYAQPYEPAAYPAPQFSGGSRAIGPRDQRDDAVRAGFRRPALPVPVGKHAPETPSSITKRGDAVPMAPAEEPEGKRAATRGSGAPWRPSISSGSSGGSPLGAAPPAGEARAPASAKASGPAAGTDSAGPVGSGGGKSAGGAPAKEAAALAPFKGLNTLGGQALGSTGAEMDAAIKNIQEKEFAGAEAPAAEKTLFERHSTALQRCQLRGCVRGELP